VIAYTPRSTNAPGYLLIDGHGFWVLLEVPLDGDESRGTVLRRTDLAQAAWARGSNRWEPSPASRAQARN